MKLPYDRTVKSFGICCYEAYKWKTAYLKAVHTNQLAWAGAGPFTAHIRVTEHDSAVPQATKTEKYRKIRLSASSSPLT